MRHHGNECSPHHAMCPGLIQDHILVPPFLGPHQTPPPEGWGFLPVRSCPGIANTWWGQPCFASTYSHLLSFVQISQKTIPGPPAPWSGRPTLQGWKHPFSWALTFLHPEQISSISEPKGLQPSSFLTSPGHGPVHSLRERGERHPCTPGIPAHCLLNLLWREQRADFCVHTHEAVGPPARNLWSPSQHCCEGLALLAVQGPKCSILL